MHNLDTILKILTFNTSGLRDTNILGFKQWLPDSSLDADWKEDLKEYFSKEEQEQGSNVQIFASPFYWSAFCAIGKGV